jgi:type VI secretion system protein ImpK
VREQRQLRDEPLSALWQGVQNRRNPIVTYLPWWIIGAAGIAALAIGFFIYQTKLRTAAEPIKTALVSTASAVQYADAIPTRASRLKQLLAPEISSGELTVEEVGAKTIVTLVAKDLFRSGSAKVGSAYVSTMKAVARALNDVPGRVEIVGHTDDQPVKSFQFADNFELSRERAVAVANLLKGSLDDFGRVQWSGVGSTQPRYRPVDTSENRARNRRVEIIHTPAGE